MKQIKRLILTATASLTVALSASALQPEAYTEHSVLSSGKWVKISVEQTGMHYIPNSALSAWGFKNPQAVRIHGYGGRMLSDVLDPAEYIDDLPEIPREQTPGGLVFYAVGPVQEVYSDQTATLAHEVNPYDTKGYYFLTESAEGAAPAPEPSGQALSSSAGCHTSAQAILIHEQETASPGGSGRLMVGEDFNYTRRRNFSFRLPGVVTSEPVQVNTSFFARTPSLASTLRFEFNGSRPDEDAAVSIPATVQGEGYWGKQLVFSHSGITCPAGELTIGLSYECNGVVNMANLDYFEVIYTRNLNSSGIFFAEGTKSLALGASDSNRRVWDVTTAHKPMQINLGTNGAWRSDFTNQMRQYVSWSLAEIGSMPQPRKVSTVSAQNLHGMTEIPDMIIIAPSFYQSAARAIADIHENNAYDPLRVEVADLNQILNEFGSGAFDPGAIRRFLKMLYDRGKASGTSLKYALLMGKGTCDNRALTGTGKAQRSPMPLWVSIESLGENSSFSSDDYFALLDDYDGRRPGQENLDIAVGRIPCTTTDEAAIAVDKIKRYIYSQPRDDWRTRLTILADDENSGVHMTQSERLLSNLSSTDAGNRFVVQKVYCDAYERQNSTYPQARTEVFDYLADGTAVFAFIGHGSPTALGSKKIIEPNDFRDRFHLRRLPFFYTATCNFLKWDYSLTSMAEQLMFQSDGGIIGCFAALRPVFITQNGNLSAQFGTTLGSLAEDGRELTIGELYRRSKNGVQNDMNKMRFVLMADPALRLSAPGQFVKVETVNGFDATNPDAQIELKARQTLTITGAVLGPDGNTMEDFNGRLIASLYDAERSVTSYGHGDGERVVFEKMGDKLLTASGTVTNGRFTLTCRMPSSFADNYRPATFSFYASAAGDSDSRHAMGVLRNVYAYGYDENAETDDSAPMINSLSLNSDGFKDGGKVNESPMVIAHISDDRGINVSMNSIGRQMVVIIDDNETYADCARHFTLDVDPVDGAAMSGTLAYPLNDLPAGNHTLKLRVWDVADNVTERTLEFNVVPGMKPEIFSVYTDAMPARTEANFFIRHNRPDALMNIRLAVYTLNGKEVWSSELQTRSNINTTDPIRWNLTDKAGRRVERGIYLYRAEISTDGQTFTTSSRKIAVAADGTN